MAQTLTNVTLTLKGDAPAAINDILLTAADSDLLLFASAYNSLQASSYDSVRVRKMYKLSEQS